MKRIIFISSFVFILLAGCSSNQIKHKNKSELIIVNHMDIIVQSLEISPCSDPDLIDEKIISLKPGKQKVIDYTTACSNMTIKDMQGNIISHQDKISTPPSFKWTLY